MVDALKTQEQDPAAGELSFLERLGLLVDQQWTWRENQALARRLHAAKLKGASVEDIDYRTSRGLGQAQLADNFGALQRVDVRVQIAHFDAQGAIVLGQFFRHALG